MTSMITIDAHAGWDIEVGIEDQYVVPEGLEVLGTKPWVETKRVIAAGTKDTIAIFDTRRISYIREVKR